MRNIGRLQDKSGTNQGETKQENCGRFVEDWQGFCMAIVMSDRPCTAENRDEDKKNLLKKGLSSLRLSLLFHRLLARQKNPPLCTSSQN
jgi:hypothetical protein